MKEINTTLKLLPNKGGSSYALYPFPELQLCLCLSPLSPPLHLSLSHKTLISSPSEFPDSSFLPSLNSSYTDTVLALTNSSSTLYDAHTTPKVSIIAASILPFGSLFDSFEVGDSRHRSLYLLYTTVRICAVFGGFLSIHCISNCYSPKSWFILENGEVSCTILDLRSRVLFVLSLQLWAF